MMCQRIGLPPISTIGFGRTSVSSANLEPSPPARIPTFTAPRPLRDGRAASWMSTSSEVFQPKALEHQPVDELGPAHEVPAPQPSRLAHQPKQPFKTALLHPGGRRALESGHEVEGRTDTHGDGHVEQRTMTVHPHLLLRSAQSDPQDIGVGGVYPA